MIDRIRSTWNALWRPFTVQRRLDAEASRLMIRGRRLGRRLDPRMEHRRTTP